MSQDPVIEQIKEKLPVAQVLKDYLTLSPAGRNFKANCPFHNEKTPSFIISPDRGTWHCFGCSAHGDIFTFLMRRENIEFSEALKLLAEEAGVELRRLRPADYQASGILYDINQIAAEFFRARLREAAPVRDYLRGRKLEESTQEEFSVGWAPNEPEALTLHLLNKNFSPEDIVRSGLAFRNDSGMVIDRFRGRVMFPISNHLGKVVAFTGRIFPPLDDGRSGKYVNSPETSVYSKSRILYGYHKSKEHIRNTNATFLVEGQMDFLMSYQAGIKNVVAVSGTALTVDHLSTLRRLCEEIFLSFDSDDAGWAAAEKALYLAAAQDFSVKLVKMPEGCKDVADAVAFGKEFLEKAIREAVPALQALMERHIPSDLNPRSKEGTRAVQSVIRIFSRISSPVEKDNWLNRLSRYTGIPENSLKEEMKSQQQGVVSSSVQPSGLASQEIKEGVIPRINLLTEEVLAGASFKNDYSQIDEKYLDEFYLKILNLLKSGEKKSEDEAIDAVMERILMKYSEAENMEEAWSHLVSERKKEWRNGLLNNLRRAEKEGNSAEVARLLGLMKDLG